MTTSAPIDVRHLIGDQWRSASDGATFETRDPHDGTLLGQVARGTADDGRDAIECARTAFDEGVWPKMAPKERATILHRVADAVDEHREELALLETRDGGKTITQSLHAEIPRVAHNLRFFADYVAMAANEAYPDGDLLSYVLYPPAGVVSAISPWNAPLMLATWKVAPALAFGNTVVLKPAPQTPLTANRFAEIALEAGLPPGVLNVVHGYGGEAVAGPLTSDPRVDRITFTGSSATGVKILQAAACNHTPVSAEMGGKSANIVFDDADLDLAVPMSLRAIFGGNGQVCLSGTRLLVQNSIREEFLERFTAEAAKLVVGDPKRPDTFMGPLIEEQHLKKVHGYVELAQEEVAWRQRDDQTWECTLTPDADRGLAGATEAIVRYEVAVRRARFRATQTSTALLKCADGTDQAQVLRLLVAVVALEQAKIVEQVSTSTSFGPYTTDVKVRSVRISEISRDGAGAALVTFVAELDLDMSNRLAGEGWGVISRITSSPALGEPSGVHIEPVLARDSGT